MFIHNTNIIQYVDFLGMKARIFRFKVHKSCANGDSGTLEFMLIQIRHTDDFPSTDTRLVLIKNPNYC